MIIFRIVSEPDGWYVATDVARSGPCLSRALAVERAEGMIVVLRRAGEDASLDAGDGGAGGPSDPSRATEAMTA